MSRIHPSPENKNGSHRLHSNKHEDSISLSPKDTVLTVWKRSSMTFQGTDGFTVYDGNGSLAFRVDNYSRNSGSCSLLYCRHHGGSGGSNDALVLMDGRGKPLLTLKPQIFSLQSQWNGFTYPEDDFGSTKKIDRRIFTMRRPPSTAFVFGRTQKKETQCEAEVFLNHYTPEPEADGISRKLSKQPDYRIEGSFLNRNCKIRSTVNGEIAAKITRKTTCASTMKRGSTVILSEEVFSLVVKRGFDPQIIMAFVVILDRICFRLIFTPRMCS